jgi:hypothetical protein
MNLALPTALSSGKQVGGNATNASSRHLLKACSESSAKSQENGSFAPLFPKHNHNGS